VRKRFIVSSKAFPPIFFISLTVVVAVTFVLGLSNVLFLPAVIIANITVILHLLRAQKKARYGALASLTALVPLFFYLCHFLYQTAMQLGLAGYDKYIIFDPQLYKEATILALAGFFSLLAGSCVAELLYSKENPQKRNQTGNGSNNDLKFNRIAVISSVVFFLIFVEEIFRIGTAQFAAMSYSNPNLTAQFSRVMDNSQKFFMFSIIAAIASLPRERWKRSIILPGTLAFIFVVILAIWGYRGHTGIFLLICYCMFAIRVHPLPLKILAVLFIGMIISWSIILTARSIPISERDYASILDKSATSDSIIEIALRTPGQMITTVSRTMSLYPHTFPYLLGKSYFDSIYYIIPNIFRDKRDSSSLYSFSITMSSYYYFGGISRSKITKGVGSTPLAEAYGNFGVFGVFILFLLGWFVTRMELILIGSKECWRLAFLGVFSYTILWAMRNDCLSVARNLTYGYVLLKMQLLFASFVRVRLKTIQPSGFIDKKGEIYPLSRRFSTDKGNR